MSFSDGLFGGGGALQKERAQIPHLLVLLLADGREVFAHERLQDGHDELQDGEIGARAFLDVEHADLDGLAVEPRDGPAGVDPFVLQHLVGIERREVAVDPLQDLLRYCAGVATDSGTTWPVMEGTRSQLWR